MEFKNVIIKCAIRLLQLIFIYLNSSAVCLVVSESANNGTNTTTVNYIATILPDPKNVPQKLCNGTNLGLFNPINNRTDHLRSLQERYTNCTVVNGNLELTWIGNNTDLNFIQHIREVIGYVLVYRVSVNILALTSLKKIHGRNLFHPHQNPSSKTATADISFSSNKFSLLVTESRIDVLELPTLEAVTNGDVGIFNNYKWWNVSRLNWDTIVSSQANGAKFTHAYKQPLIQDCTDKEFNYTMREKCLDLNLNECPSDNLYLDTEISECLPCHEDCIGCTGPHANNCMNCKNYRIYTKSTLDDLEVKTGHNLSFNCTMSKTCSPEFPQKNIPGERDREQFEPFCSAREGEKSLPGYTIAIVTIVIVIVIVNFITVFVMDCRKKGGETVENNCTLLAIEKTTDERPKILRELTEYAF